MLIRCFLFVKMLCVHWESRIILGLLNFFYTLNIEQKKAVKIKRHISRKTFQRILMDIVTEKIISTPIWATKIFFEISALLYVRYCSKLQSCAISRKTNYATLRKWQKP